MSIMREDISSRGRTTVVYIKVDRSNALLVQCLLGPRKNYTLHHAYDGASGLELCNWSRVAACPPSSC